MFGAMKRMSRLRVFLCTYPCSLLLTLFIWVVCLMPIPETPLDNVTLIDKWVHIVMYLLLAVTIGVEYYRAYKANSTGLGVVLRAWFFPAAMGGAIELAQAYLTTCRTGDWMDFLANGIGATLGFIVCLLVKKLCIK